MRILALILFIISSTVLCAQCPDDPKIGEINTQEKYDYFFENYPNCREFHIIKHNGEFIGAPRTTQYSLALLFSLIGILVALKLIFRFRKM